MKKTTTNAEMTTYLLIMKDGTKQKITCPTKWTLTFGPLCPGTKGEYNGSNATSLRIREGAHQKAVFTGVESFRDTSMGIEVEISKTQQETFYRDDPEGGDKKQVIVEGSVKEWINPDAPKPTRKPESNMPKLLQATNIFSKE
jgi:hypothetical protein